MVIRGSDDAELGAEVDNVEFFGFHRKTFRPLGNLEPCGAFV